MERHELIEKILFSCITKYGYIESFDDEKEYCVRHSEEVAKIASGNSYVVDIPHPKIVHVIDLKGITSFLIAVRDNFNSLFPQDSFNSFLDARYDFKKIYEVLEYATILVDGVHGENLAAKSTNSFLTKLGAKAFIKSLKVFALMYLVRRNTFSKFKQFVHKKEIICVEEQLSKLGLERSEMIKTIYSFMY